MEMRMCLFVFIQEANIHGPLWYHSGFPNNTRRRIRQMNNLLNQHISLVRPIQSRN